MTNEETTRVFYSCGCEAGGDLIASKCPIHLKPFHAAYGPGFSFSYFHCEADAARYAEEHGGYDILETSPKSIWRVTTRESK